MATATVTPDQTAVAAEVFIAAPPERVFSAITDPAQMPRWWGQTGMYRVTEWKADLCVGGKWRSDGISKDGRPFYVEGEYLEIDPPRLLVHTWTGDFHPEKTVVRWELEPQKIHGLHPGGPKTSGTGTLVRIRHEGFTTAESATNHADGWKRVMGWLVGYLERGETIDTRK